MSSSSSGDDDNPADESLKRPNFVDIPIYKFPDYVERNDVYMFVEDISYFLGNIIPASDVESLMEEWREISPRKVKKQHQEFILFESQFPSGKRKKKFYYIQESILECQKQNKKTTPSSVIEATRNSNRFCFLNAERVHQMFLHSIMDTESESGAFSLLRSILDEKIIKSPYKSSIGIHADFPSMEQKKEGKVDVVFPPEFRRTKHSLWVIRKHKKKDNAEKSEKESASSSTGSSSSKKSLFIPLESNPIGGLETSIETQKHTDIETQKPTDIPITNTTTTSSTIPSDTKTLNYSLISIGTSVRLLYSIDLSKSSSIYLTISLKEHEDAVKSGDKQTRTITLNDSRIQDLWILEYAFGFSYSGGIVGIPSSQFFNSGLSIVLDRNLLPLLEGIRTRVTNAIPFSESILKKGVKTPQQLTSLVSKEIFTDSSDGAPSTNTTANSSITANSTDNYQPVNNSIIESSNIQSPNNTPVNMTKSNEEHYRPTDSEMQSNNRFITDDGKIDLNQCDISINWEETSGPTNENYSDSHSACYDDDDEHVNRKRVFEEEANEHDESLKKIKVIEKEEELDEPHHVTVLKRLLQFKLIQEEEFQSKLKFFHAINEYKSGSWQPLQEIISSQIERLNNFSDYESFICPLTNKFILDPVLAPDGLLYERKALSQWITTFSSVSLLGGCRVTTFTNIPSAVEEVNRILSQKIEKNIEFIEQIVEQGKIYCVDLLPLIDQVIYYDTLNKHIRKLLELKSNIIYNNISTIVNGCERFFECGKELLQMETEKNARIQLSITMLDKKPTPEYYSYFSNVIYESCGRSIDELKKIPSLPPDILNNILTLIFIQREANTSQFFNSVNIDLSSQPTTNQWIKMLILLSYRESEILSSIQ